MTRLRRLTAAGLVLVAIGACSSSPGASVTASPTATPRVTPSAAPSSPATSGAVPALEALIPDKVGAMTLEKTSMKGSDFLTSSAADQNAVAFLQALGVAPVDIGIAFGYGFDPSNSAGFAMFVFQAAGVDEARLMSVFTSASSQGRTTPLDWQAADVGGKHLRVATDTETQGIKLYLYGHGDALFLLSATSEDVVTEALHELP